jgi:hypothetical protein
MEGPVIDETGQTGETPGGRLGRDLGLIALLLVLACGIRALVLGGTEVVARDGIIFINYAWQLEHKNWGDVLCENPQHPGYPLSVLAMSLPVRHFLGPINCDTMQWSAQLASALAGVLLVIPMFLLGKTLFDRGVGFWGALLFQCLPVSGRILSDGLSEGLFLLLVTTALLLAVRGLRSSSQVRFVLCGIFSGLAYLTRPEGAVVVVALLLLLLLMQRVPAWRKGWKWTLTRGAGVALAALVVGSPYLLVTLHLTGKPSGQKMLKTAQLQDEDSEAAPGDQESSRESLPPEPGGPAFDASPCLLAVWLNPEAGLVEKLAIGLRAVGVELVKGFHHFAWLPALLGLWWYRRQLAPRPEAWLLMILCVVHGVVLWRLSVVAGYVSERHVLLLVLCGIYPAVAGLRDLPKRLMAWRRKSSSMAAGPGSWLGRLRTNAALWSVVLLVAACGICLPKTFQPLHANRAGHHAAGLWLAAHARPSDEICDGHFGWASYYAGRFFIDPKQNPQPAAKWQYVVKGKSNAIRNPYGPTAAEADQTEKQILANGGTVVYYWPPGGSLDRAQVKVWQINLSPKVGKGTTSPVKHHDQQVLCSNINTGTPGRN